MKVRLSLLAASLTLFGLVGCAEQPIEATLSLEVSGLKEVVGETVTLSATSSGVNRESTVIFEEKVGDSDWREVGSVVLASGELEASITDEVDAGTEILYRAKLVLDSAEAQVAESIPEVVIPVTLQEFVDQQMLLDIQILETPDNSGYLFDGDEVVVYVDAILASDASPASEVTLSFEGSEPYTIVEGIGLGSSQVDWNVELRDSAVSSGQLLLTATITGNSGSATKEARLDVTTASPVFAYDELAAKTNAADPIERRQLVEAAAGEIYLDATSESWNASRDVQILFVEPFLGEVSNFVSWSDYQVPWSCAPGGQVDSAPLPGRSFVVETPVQGSEFDESIFGYFDGQDFYFSVAWRYCF